MKTTEHLVISALGEDRPGIVNDLTQLILDCACNVVDSRMTVLGGEFALMLLVSGAAADIERLEQALPALAGTLSLTLISKKTRPRPPQPDRIPYRVHAVALDHPGIVHQLAQFFSSRHINIESLETDSYAAAHTGAPMFALTMLVNVPGETRIAALREEFLGFCDELNIDVTMEPLHQGV